MSILHTDPARVTDIEYAPMPHHLAGLQWTASGYGRKLPSRWRVRYRHMDDSLRWHRVYVTLYSNAGTAWIGIGGKRLVLDIDTEHRLNDYQRKEGAP